MVTTPHDALVSAVVQETSRLVRCRDSPTNSVLGGAATGALLYKIYGALAVYLAVRLVQANSLAGDKGSVLPLAPRSK